MLKPKLRFPEFTDKWEEKQLKDFMTFKNGLNADKDKFGRGVKFISVMDILNNQFIIYDTIIGKVDVDEKTLDNYSVTYGDVLFQRSSETRVDAGKSNVYLDKEKVATFGGFVIRGKRIGDYSPEFMNSLLKTPMVRKEIINKAQGAQHINVGQETLENVNIIIPVIEEQEQIAVFLSSVDDIIQVQEEKISALEEQKKGMMQKLFNCEVRFKADDGREFPEWEEASFYDIFSIIKNNTLSRNCLNYNMGKVLNIHYGDVLIKYGAFIDVSKEEIPFINSDVRTNNLPESSYLCNGDIVIADTAEDMTVGKATEICGCSESKVLAGLHTIPCRPKIRFASKYLGYYINSKEYHNQLIPLIQGIKVSSISKTNIRKTLIVYPCVEEQQKIADCLSAYDEIIQIKKDKLEAWKEIKKGLLQQMFV